MHLKNINLHQFKNYHLVRAEFSNEINCFLGTNGSGKTNLLDAIHYLCFTRSAFNTVDVQNILHEKSFFTIKGDFELEEKNIEIKCIVESGKKKQMLHTGKAYDKMSEHIGLLPVVMIAPDDTQLIKDGSEGRRNFFDSIISQLDKPYLHLLVRYQHFLKQRNALLKQFSESGQIDQSLLEPYNIEIINLTKSIYIKRETFIQDFLKGLQKHYGVISGEKETVEVVYQSDGKDLDFETKFKASLSRDIILKRTNKGIHKDDFVFTIGGYPLKKFGSQGQQKSFLIALKLSQFQILKERKGILPILLLDDIFDKLDDLRIAKMIELVANHEFGQLFITDARPERSKQILSTINADKRYFNIKDGMLSPD
ncbi:DNA replication/repair protein RecF [Anditalea andensis]|uniref:DNA replication and repair protein RecF n=1 Tax=Anditalea andensis TaxID=1048983 RepID=A0A074LHA4_9BACT|nr:DNA replication and repair protein RecF [Anditalea andensis]KEO73147.1 DNA recombination protein RecF [Anditalea andensis]